MLLTLKQNYDVFYDWIWLKCHFSQKDTNNISFEHNIFHITHTNKTWILCTCEWYISFVNKWNVSHELISHLWACNFNSKFSFITWNKTKCITIWWYENIKVGLKNCYVLSNKFLQNNMSYIGI